jgi:hypothetical protein
VALVVSRLVLLGVDEGRDDTTGVTDRDDDGGGDTFLEGSTDIVGSPRDDDGNEGVHAGCGEEETDVVDSGNFGDDQEHVSNSTDEGEGHDNDTSLFNLVGPVSSANGGDGSEDVRGNRELRGQRDTFKLAI